MKLYLWRKMELLLPRTPFTLSGVLPRTRMLQVTFSPCWWVGILIIWYQWNPKRDTWFVSGWFLTIITLLEQWRKCVVWENFHNLCTLRNLVDNSLERGVELGSIVIQWIHVSVDKSNCALHWMVIYPLHNIVRPLNNWGIPPTTVLLTIFDFFFDCIC